MSRTHAPTPTATTTATQQQHRCGEHTNRRQQCWWRARARTITAPATKPTNIHRADHNDSNNRRGNTDNRNCTAATDTNNNNNSDIDSTIKVSTGGADLAATKRHRGHQQAHQQQQLIPRSGFDPLTHHNHLGAIHRKAISRSINQAFN